MAKTPRIIECVSCNRQMPHASRGLCRSCYERHKAAGLLDQFPRAVRLSFVERFWNKVNLDAPNGCWQWPNVNNLGYGNLTVRNASGVKTTIGAHRVAYELLIGPIPKGLVIDHLCRNRGCVNPAHMEPVTNGENVLRGEGISARGARQTHCKHGHELTPENTFLSQGRHRVCLTCRRARARDRYYKVVKWTRGRYAS